MRLCPKAASFYENYYDYQKEPRTSYQCLFKFFFNDPYHLNILDALIQRDFCAIPKFAIDNLCKPFQDGTIISFSISFWNLKILDKKEEIFKSLSASRTKKILLSWVFKMIWLIIASFWDFLAYIFLHLQMKPQYVSHRHSQFEQ